MSARADARIQSEAAVVASVARFDDLQYGASYRDIKEDTGLGLGTVFKIVAHLVEVGTLVHTPHIARSIRRA